MDLPQRKLPRLTGYNYANEGYYFVTICTNNMRQLFWNDIKDGTNCRDGSRPVRKDGTVKTVPYSEIGIIAERKLINEPLHFEDVKIHKYAIMPNHIHCIVIIECGEETKRIVGTGVDPSVESERSRPFPTLSTIIGLYKSGVSKSVHVQHPDITVWQKSFHDHIIRSEADYQRIWQYIDENPQKWAEDCYFVKG